MEKENGRKWDGKSRVSNDTYRKRYDEIFKKEKTTSELLEEGFEEAVACHMATESYLQGRRVEWDPVKKRIV